MCLPEAQANRNLGGLTYPEHGRATHGTLAARGRPSVLQRDLLGFIDVPVGAALEAVSLHGSLHMNRGRTTALPLWRRGGFGLVQRPSDEGTVKVPRSKMCHGRLPACEEPRGGIARHYISHSASPQPPTGYWSPRPTRWANPRLRRCAAQGRVSQGDRGVSDLDDPVDKTANACPGVHGAAMTGLGTLN